MAMLLEIVFGSFLDGFWVVWVVFAWLLGPVSLAWFRDN